MLESFLEIWGETGFPYVTWQMGVMWGVAGVLLYLAVRHQFEPLLLVPIAFGALLANLPTEGIVNRPGGWLESPGEGVIEAIHLEVDDRMRLPRSPAEGRVAVAFTIGLTDEAGNRKTRPDGSPVLRRVMADRDGHVVDVRKSVGDRVHAGEPVMEVAADHAGGLFYYLYKGIHWELFPPIIFLGVGALTDFGPLIANPRTLLLGAAAQFGVFATFLGAITFGLTSLEAAAIGIIGGADGPTSIFLANKLAPHLLAPIAVAAYSYMSLVPIIQPPIMRALTSEKERRIRMRTLRPVSKLEKLIFAVAVLMLCILVVPAASPLIFMLMFGNFLRECAVTERLLKSAQNEIINITTIFLGTCVGITMTGERFLQWETIKILVLGMVAFGIATAAGVLMAKGMNLVSRNKINPLIGSAGVSAVPMAARVSQVEGQRADPANFLLMHAMGPNVAGVIGTAVAAGFFIATLG